jgi:DNA-binding PadR family transcriptional regulator
VPIKLTLSCESEIEKDIENALMNSGLQFTKEEIKEPVEGYIIYLPSVIGAFSVALHILESKKDVIKGSIELPNGKRYELTEDGRAQLREVLIEALNKKREPATGIETIWWTPFIPEIKEFIKTLTSLVEWYPRASGEGKHIITRNFLLLIGVIVLGMGILTYLGKLSGDSFALVIGTLLGYIFAFLQKYLGILVED